MALNPKYENSEYSAGSEQNPYAIETFQDFLDVIDTAGAYGELQNDINVKQEGITYYDNPLELKCTKVYSTGNTKTISKLTVRASEFIKNTTATTTIENINFENCAFRGTGGSSQVFATGGNTNWSLFINDCKFSLVCHCNGKFWSGSNSSKAKNSSFNIKFGNSSVVTHSSQERYDTCSVIFTGGTHNFSGVSTTTATQNFYSYSSIIFNNAKLTGDSSNNLTFSKYVGALSYSYVCVKDCESSTGDNLEINRGTSSVTNTSPFLVCIDNSPQISAQTISGYMEVITPNNLKDYDYLVDIGFIP